jgi:hypothetical protein
MLIYSTLQVFEATKKTRFLISFFLLICPTATRWQANDIQILFLAQKYVHENSLFSNCQVVAFIVWQLKDHLPFSGYFNGLACATECHGGR